MSIILWIYHYFSLGKLTSHNNNISKLSLSPSKNISLTPSMTIKKSQKTPKEKRRSSKTDPLSPPISLSGTQWYTSETEANATINGTPVIELRQEVSLKFISLCFSVLILCCYLFCSWHRNDLCVRKLRKRKDWADRRAVNIRDQTVLRSQFEVLVVRERAAIEILLVSKHQ